VVAETIASGYTFQGKLLRPAVVRLREAGAPAAPPSLPSASVKPPARENEEDELPLGGAGLNVGRDAVLRRPDSAARCPEP